MAGSDSAGTGPSAMTTALDDSLERASLIEYARSRDPSEELVAVCDHHNKVIGYLPRGVVRSRNLIHRCSTIICRRRATTRGARPTRGNDGRRREEEEEEGPLFYVQRRTDTKDYCPGEWDVSTGGVCGAGESNELCARRELSEELGLMVDGGGEDKGMVSLRFLKIFFYGDELTRCFHYLWEAVFDEPPTELKVQASEVVEVRLMSAQEIERLSEKSGSWERRGGGGKSRKENKKRKKSTGKKKNGEEDSLPPGLSSEGDRRFTRDGLFAFQRYQECIKEEEREKKLRQGQHSSALGFTLLAFCSLAVVAIALAETYVLDHKDNEEEEGVVGANLDGTRVEGARTNFPVGLGIITRMPVKSFSLTCVRHDGSPAGKLAALFSLTPIFVVVGYVSAIVALLLVVVSHAGSDEGSRRELCGGGEEGDEDDDVTKRMIREDYNEKREVERPVVDRVWHALTLLVLSLLGQLVDTVLNMVLKRLLIEPRPRWSTQPGLACPRRGYGLPSNHAQFMTFLLVQTVFSAMLPAHSTTGRRSMKTRRRGGGGGGGGRRRVSHDLASFIGRSLPLLSWLAFLPLALVVALSRVILGYHSTRQVLVGAAVGCASGVLWALLVLNPLVMRWTTRVLRFLLLQP